MSEAAFSAEPEAATKVARKGHPSARIARKKDQRREAILRAGSEVFAEMGYHRASLEEIAERIDLTRAALYHYFPSKDALLTECLDYGAEQAIARLSEVFDATSELDADFRLAALVRTQLTFITSDSREISQLFLNQMDWPETFRSRVKTMRDRHDMFFRKVITDGIASGEFNCIDVEVAHHCLHGSMNYAAVWLRPQSKSLTRSINALVDSLLLLFHAPA